MQQPVRAARPLLGCVTFPDRQPSSVPPYFARSSAGLGCTTRQADVFERRLPASRHIAERLSGPPFEALRRKRVLVPLGMETCSPLGP